MAVNLSVYNLLIYGTIPCKFNILAEYITVHYIITVTNLALKKSTVIEGLGSIIQKGRYNKCNSQNNNDCGT
jgi:hypothetical protein